jgi:tetratricopeptide (TPR) repeat protein
MTTSPTPPRLAAAPLLALPALLLLAWLAYRPGLSGGFLFDDFINLDALGRYGPVRDADAMWRYLTSGTADPLGRPLSLLSFLVDARDWPADPASFLRTNVLLHLLNGALLFALVARLGRALGDAPARARWLAVFAAGTWTLHPLWVSTTLYAVQREAMLPATFVLLGLLAYVAGRERLRAGDGRRGFALAATGLVLGTGLAALCKANGLLLPLLAGTLEVTVFAGDATNDRRVRWLRWALVAGSLLVFAWLATYLPRLATPIPSRGWSIGQRLLTEPAILLDYLKLLVVPRAVSAGLYHDDVVAARSLLDPAWTLPALLAVLALVAGLVALRRRAPALAAAGLFFFAAHLLESTVVPLELYFEHRNYLPALLLGWPLARALAAWRAPLAARAMTAVLVLALLATLTWQRSTLWGQPDRLAALWLVKSPDSPRAQATVADALMRAGDASAAADALLEPVRQRPHDAQVVFAWARAACVSQRFRMGHVEVVGRMLERTRSQQQLVYQSLANAVAIAGTKPCRYWSLSKMTEWVDRAAKNPHLLATPAARQNFHQLRGRIALARGDSALAARELEAALRERVRPQAALANVELLAAYGEREAALAHLDLYSRLAPEEAAPRAGMARVHAWVLARQGYWPAQAAQARRRLEARGPAALLGR